MRQVSLAHRIFGEPRNGVDIQRVWDHIDTFPEAEKLLMHRLYDGNGEPTDVALSAIEKEIKSSPRTRTLFNRSLRRLRGRARQLFINHADETNGDFDAQKEMEKLRIEIEQLRTQLTQLQKEFDEFMAEYNERKYDEWVRQKGLDL